PHALYPLSLPDALPIFEVVDEGRSVRRQHQAALREQLLVEQVEPEAQVLLEVVAAAAGERAPGQEAGRGQEVQDAVAVEVERAADRKSTRLNSSHVKIS